LGPFDILFDLTKALKVEYIQQFCFFITSQRQISPHLLLIAHGCYAKLYNTSELYSPYKYDHIRGKHMLKENEKFKGIVPPLVTLLTPDEKIDEQGTKKLIQHVISGGVHGIFLLGTTGEGTRITDSECEKLINIAVEQADDRIMVLAGCSDFGTRRTLERIRIAEKAGADAVVVSLSYFLPRFNNAEITKYYKQLAMESKIPVFMYNLPVENHLPLELDIIDDLSQVENIAGIKDSSQNWEHLEKLIQRLRHRDNFRIFVGTEIFMVESLTSGAHGCVPSIANVIPDVCVNIYKSIRNGDPERIENLKKQMMDTRKRVYIQGPSWLSYISGIKSTLRSLGITGKTITEPFCQ
jgi:4-hydroxy-tetrahydrodipicolinate synthase